LHRPALFPVPGFALQLVLGEGALVVAEGQRVLPARTTSLGYRFRFETIDAAFADLFARAS
jgi:NAD dependent epimerase/dehydratase family enzyme